MGRPQINWEEADSMVNQGLTYTQIANRFGITVAAVSLHYKSKKGITKLNRFTAEEDAIILECINKTPLNIKMGVELAHSLLPNRSIDTIRVRWYKILSIKESNISYLIESKAQIVANRKQQRRGIQLKVVPHTPSAQEEKVISKSFLLYNFVSSSTLSY